MAALLTVVSNGHGEDAIGAALVRALRVRRPDLEIEAYPLVGEGNLYQAEGISTLGPCQALPSAGLTLHSRANLSADLRAGLFSLMARQFTDLARHRTDVLLIVGDLFAQLLSAAIRSKARFVYQPLVSVRQMEGSPPPVHRRAMERFTYLERLLLRHRAHRVYVRDAASASWLRSHGVDHAVFLGNPAVDAVAAAVEESARGVDDASGNRVALLPGSRTHADRSLDIMLSVIDRGGWEASVAWAMPHAPSPAGWFWQPCAGSSTRSGSLVRGSQTVAVYDRSVVSALRGARAALGTTGTATEQAAAAGVPVVSFPTPPEITTDFLAGQKRLLGDALEVVEASPAKILAAIETLLADERAHARAARAGRSRMGGAGGTQTIVEDLLAGAVALGAIRS